MNTSPSRAAAVLFTLALAAPARAGDAVSVAVDSRDGCPAESWFREQLALRGVRGGIRVSIGADAEGYSGDIEARSEDGALVRRHLTGARCATVAEGLLVVAEVHLAGLPAPAPPPTPPVRPPPPPPSTARPSAPAPPPAAPLARFSLGALVGFDTAVTGDPAFGGGLTAWVAFGGHPMRGLALSGVYSRADVTKTVPVTHEHLRARLDAIPFDLSFGRSTSLGFALFLSGGSLRVSADVAQPTPGIGALWMAGAGLRLRRVVGPVFVELGADVTLALTRRRFEVTGLAAPIFSLPPAGAAAALSVGVPIGR